ncbi:MAG: ribosome-recycling factor, partial [Bacteroidia bacterium]
MNEEVQIYLDETKESMEKALAHLNYELGKIRAGKASTGMVEGVMVEYYGAPTPLNQVANVNTPDARTIIIQPWEKSVISAIERGIINANLGLAPTNDGII